MCPWELPWVTPKAAVLLMKGAVWTVFWRGAEEEGLPKAPGPVGRMSGWGPGGSHKGSSLWGCWNPVGFLPACPRAPDSAGAQKQLTGHSPGPGFPLRAALFVIFHASLYFLFPFLLFSLSYFYSPLFSFSLTFIFLSSLDYSHSFSPCFIVTLYISFTLTSWPSRTPVLQLMILKRIFWRINFS